MLAQTTCEHCVFSLKRKEKQYACELGRLERYMEKGIKTTKRGVGDKSYYIIDTICSAVRMKDWADSNTGNLIERVNKELEVKVNFLIYIDKYHCLEDTLQYLNITLESINNQSIKPNKVIILLDFNCYEIKTIYNFMIKEYPCLPFKIEQIFEPISREESQYFLVGKSDSLFFTWCEVGYIYNSNFLADFNEYMVNKLGEFAIIQPDVDYNGFLTTALFFNFIKTINSPEKSFLDKAYEYLEESELTHLVIDRCDLKDLT